MLYAFALLTFFFLANLLIEGLLTKSRMYYIYLLVERRFLSFCFFSSPSPNMQVTVSSLINFRNVWWCDYFLSFRGISNAYCCFLFVPIYNVILNWCLYVTVLRWTYTVLICICILFSVVLYITLFITQIYLLILFSLEINSVLMIVCFVILIISVGTSFHFY